MRAYLCPLEEAGALPVAGEADLRYAGQSFELTVPLGPMLAERFHQAHEARNGYAARGRPIELVAVRTAEIRRGRLDVVGRSHAAHSPCGPELVELEGATCWVPAGWQGETDTAGTLVLERR